MKELVQRSISLTEEQQSKALIIEGSDLTAILKS